MKRKAKQPGLTLTLTPEPTPTRPGYWWLYCPWGSINAPVEVRAWCTGWQVFRTGSLYPLRSSQHYDGAKWYFLGPLMAMIGGDAAM